MSTASDWVTEGVHDGAFLVSEAQSGATGVSRSREVASYVGAVALDAGTVVVVDSAGAIVPYVNGTTAAANAVLFGNTAAGDVNEQTCVVLVRDCEVNADEIAFATGETAGGIIAGLAELKAAGIIARESV